MINRYTFAGLLAVLAVLGIGALGVFVVGGGDDTPAARSTDTVADGGTPPTEQTTTSPKATPNATSTATPPPQKTKNLAQAAKLAGCTVVAEPDEGAEHVDRDVTAADYATNPPTSGIHDPQWAPDGVYAPGSTPDLGMLVHTLEHGRINIQYEPGTGADTVSQLGALYRELDDGHHLLVYENQTDMPFAIAATAWDHLLGCPKMNDKVFDAIRAFTATFVDKGPEVVP